MMIAGITAFKFFASAVIGAAVAHRVFVVMTKEEIKEFLEEAKNTTF